MSYFFRTGVLDHAVGIGCYVGAAVGAAVMLPLWVVAGALGRLQALYASCRYFMYVNRFSCILQPCPTNTAKRLKYLLMSESRVTVTSVLDMHATHRKHDSTMCKT
jgi:hypothetical protein